MGTETGMVLSLELQFISGTSRKMELNSNKILMALSCCDYSPTRYVNQAGLFNSFIV